MLANREFRALLAAQLVSIAGDQLARVALSVLVYDRTRSALFAALVYAASLLPLILAGPLLGGLADRRPRRSVMVAADLVRAALAAVMAVPGVPIAVLVVFVVAISVAQAPFSAARAAILPDVLPGRAAYLAGSGLERAVVQSAQVAGYALGGLLLLVVRPRVALAIDAGTFVVSAGLVRAVLVARGAAVVAGPARGSSWRRAVEDARGGARLVFGWAALRRPILLTWTGLLIAILPEGLAAPYAAALHAGPAGVGVLLAAGPAGNVVAGLSLPHLPDRVRERALLPMAVLALLPLVGCLANPPLPAAAALIALSGVGMSYSLLARAQAAALMPAQMRGRVFAIANAGIAAAQGAGAAIGGAVAGYVSVHAVLGVSGALGAVLVGGVVLTSRSRSAPAPAAAADPDHLGVAVPAAD